MMYFALKVWLLSDGPDNSRYVPAIQVHHNDCKRQHGCCDWWLERCEHLKSVDLGDARQKARALARRLGVPFDG